MAKTQILRKLDLIASDTLAYLELLRTSADQQLKIPLVGYTPIVPDYPGTVVMPPVMAESRREEERYIVSITNVDDVVKSQKFIWLFSRWYRRDRYLQVAAHGHGRQSSSGIAVYLNWGTTEQGSFFAYPDAKVYVKHPDNTEEKNVYLKHCRARVGSFEPFSFHEICFIKWDEICSSGLVRGGKITLVISFKNW